MLSRIEESNITDSRFKKTNICLLLARVYEKVVFKNGGCRIYINVSFSIETSSI